VNNDRLIEQKLKEIEALVLNNEEGSIKSVLLYADNEVAQKFTFGIPLRHIPEDFDHFVTLIRSKFKIAKLRYCFKYWFYLGGKK
jgi:hypothetical protein